METRDYIIDKLYDDIDTLDKMIFDDYMRKHVCGVAHWENVHTFKNGLFLARCSKCKRKYKIKIKKWWNFCPYCGAKMKGE